MRGNYSNLKRMGLPIGSILAFTTNKESILAFPWYNA